MRDKTTLDRDLGAAPRVGTDVAIELGNTLDLGKELYRDLCEIILSGGDPEPSLK